MGLSFAPVQGLEGTGVARSLCISCLLGALHPHRGGRSEAWALVRRLRCQCRMRGTRTEGGAKRRTSTAKIVKTS